MKVLGQPALLQDTAALWLHRYLQTNTAVYLRPQSAGQVCTSSLTQRSRCSASSAAAGFSFDWDREFSTTDPEYYRWTQWIFLQLFNRGLAYQAEIPVNWCPALGTVLANEEVIDGKSERGEHPVVRLPMRQVCPFQHIIMPGSSSRPAVHMGPWLLRHLSALNLVCHLSAGCEGGRACPAQSHLPPAGDQLQCACVRPARGGLSSNKVLRGHGSAVDAAHHSLCR